MPDEVFFCGHCKQQQEPVKGEKCRRCGRHTISWFTSRESNEEVQMKWDRLFGLVLEE